MSRLRQAVHYYPDGVITGSSARLIDYKVHPNLIPFALSMKWAVFVKRSTEESAMAATNLRVSDALPWFSTVTYDNILRDRTFHSVPPESFLQVLVHYLATWVYGISCLMSFLENQFPNRFDIEKTQSICRRFETGGSLGRRVNVTACPNPDGSARGRARRGEVRWPEMGVREVEIPRPSCSSRAQVGCTCSRGLQASTRERERAASRERLSHPRPRAANLL
jgi:hypothetical protein